MAATLLDFGAPVGRALCPGDEIAGRYRIESLLAWGGMAAIYACDDAVLGRKIALKVLRPEVGSVPELIERLLNEARALARLRSRHVMQVLDCGTLQQVGDESLPFIALELLEGQDLWSALQRGRLPMPLAVRYVLQACEGLAEAHAQKIVHRDIKPENIFLARLPDGTEVVKLIDFGISKQLAKRDARPLTAPTDCVGSPQYMAPEQMRGRPVDARTDIWALGAVLFECVAGRPAFPGSTVFEISASVLQGPLPALRRVTPELPEGFARIVERCLERDPADRFPNVAELARALEPYAARERTSTSRRIAKVLALESAAEAVPEIQLVRGTVDDEPLRIEGLRSYRPTVLSLLMLALVGALAYRYPERFSDVANRMRFQLDTWLERP